MASAVENPNETVISIQQTRKSKRLLLVFPLAFFLVIITKNAWLSDDSFVTFRVVDNFIHGYGLTWNTDERVQAYTHPLWMFLVSLVYFFTHEIYSSTILPSIIASCVAVGLFSLYLARSPLLAALGIVALAASKSFVDFSTSGLENPLTYLFIVIFMIVYYRCQNKTSSVFWLTAIAGLATLNRMDTVLLFLPTLIVVFYQFPRCKSVKALLLGFLPFLCWEAFSLCYYGFLFPNTAYAKLDTGLNRLQLLYHGLGYVASSFTFDPLLCVVIVASTFLLFKKKAWSDLPFLIGIGLYLLYVITIGGDFMAGRFFTEPFLITVILLAHTSFPSSRLACFTGFAIIILFAIFTPNSRWYPLITNSSLIDQRGVADEHEFYENITGIAAVEHANLWIIASWLNDGLHARLSNRRVVVRTTIGLFGFGAGPHVHIVDIWALGDPLLARLPEGQAQDSEKNIQQWTIGASTLTDSPVLPPWRIGHFTRNIPAGYLETLESGKNMIHDKQLALYYSKLQEVIRGPLFTTQRWIAIWKFNTGGYDYLLSHYAQGIDQIDGFPLHG